MRKKKHRPLFARLVPPSRFASPPQLFAAMLGGQIAKLTKESSVLFGRLNWGVFERVGGNGSVRFSFFGGLELSRGI